MGIKVVAAVIIISSWILLHVHIVFRYKQTKNVDLQKGGFVDDCNGGGEYCSRAADRNILASQRFPDAIIIGVKKCGTRALLWLLEGHPDVKSLHHEAHHFDVNESYYLGENWYRSRMPVVSDNNVICVEKTPAYAHTEYVPERVYNFKKALKIIMIIRNPVKRFISEMTQAARKGKGPSFDKYLNTDGSVNHFNGSVARSRYLEMIQRWERYFPKNQISVVDGDQLISDPVPIMKSLERFLNITPYFARKQFHINKTKGFYCKTKPNGDEYCLGKDKGTKQIQVDHKDKLKLYNYYEKFNNQLFQHLSEAYSANVTRL